MDRNDEMESGSRGPERAFLANRIENQKKVGSLEYQTQKSSSIRTGVGDTNGRDAQVS